MRYLIVAAIFFIPSFSHGACNGLTNQQYAVEVAKIMNVDLLTVDVEDAKTVPYLRIIIRKIIKYRKAGGGPGSTEDVASRCFAEDIYKNLTGVSISRQHNNWIQNHLIENYYQGEQF